MWKAGEGLLPLLTLATALGSALIAGVFFAFSTFVMRALARLPPEHGIAAMQSINVVAVTLPFMSALFGTALLCVVLLVSSVRNWGRPDSAYLFRGSLLYLLGTVLVTIVFNVPRNNALARVDPESADARRVWRSYLRTWTAWNHVRTLAALAAAASFALALCRAAEGMGT